MTDVTDPYSAPITTDHSSPAPNPAAGPAAVPLGARPDRTLASAIAVFLGGYLLLQALTGQLVVALGGYGGMDITVTAYLLVQFIFALAVVVFGLLIAPATATRKLVASAIVVVVTVVTLVVVIGRLNGTLRVPGLEITVANTWLMGMLAVGAGWLVVRSARFGWLALLAALVLAPLPNLLTLAGAEFGVRQLVLLAVSGIVGAGIILAGRPWRG